MVVDYTRTFHYFSAMFYISSSREHVTGWLRAGMEYLLISGSFRCLWYIFYVLVKSHVHNLLNNIFLGKKIILLWLICIIIKLILTCRELTRLSNKGFWDWIHNLLWQILSLWEIIMGLVKYEYNTTFCYKYTRHTYDEVGL